MRCVCPIATVSGKILSGDGSSFAAACYNQCAHYARDFIIGFRSTSLHSISAHASLVPRLSEKVGGGREK